MPVSVLVVDDDRDSAETMAMLLETFGLTVFVAYDGPEALQVFQERSPSHVVLDIGLPGMDGREVARRLRSADSQQPPRIVALSGYSVADDGIDDEPFDVRLVKPVDLAALQRALDLP